MKLLSFLEGLLGKTEAPSESDAKKRLQVVLLHDRADLPPEQLESMKKEIFAVISKYVEIDLQELEVNLEKVEHSVALVANIPIKKRKIED